VLPIKQKTFIIKTTRREVSRLIILNVSYFFYAVDCSYLS